MKKVENWLVIFMLVLLAAFFSACGSGGGDDAPVPEVDVTGTWDGYSENGVAFVVTVKQDGAILSGTAKHAYGDSGSITGVVDGNTAKWEMIWYSGTTGTYKADVVGNHMTGSGTEKWNGEKYSFNFTAKRR